jgi:hypothetical protein
MEVMKVMRNGVSSLHHFHHFITSVYRNRGFLNLGTKNRSSAAS